MTIDELLRDVRGRRDEAEQLEGALMFPDDLTETEARTIKARIFEIRKARALEARKARK